MLNGVRYITILVVMGLFFSFGCSSSKGIKVVELFENDIKEDVICFLVMEISRDINDTKSQLKLIQQTQSVGKL